MSLLLKDYWLLTTEYPPFYGGGISTYCYFTALMLQSNGHNVTVFVNDDSVNNFLVDVKNGIREVRFNPLRSNKINSLGHVANISYEFAAIVKEFIEKEGAPDLIEAQEYLGIAYYLLQFKQLLYSWCKNIPVLITMHSPAFLYLEYNQTSVYKYPNFWIGEMERFCIQAANVVISPSKFLINEVGKYIDYLNPFIDVVPNPFVVEPKKEANSFHDNTEIIFYGKLSPQKGVLKLLEYFDNLWNTGFSEPLYLIGGQDIVYHPEGITMGQLVQKKYKKYINSGCLILEDKIIPSNLHGRLSKAKIVIVPSIVDNFPYVVMEMMSLGKVVLVSIQGGQSEIVDDGINGFTFDHCVPSTFRDKLQYILSLSNEERLIVEQKARIKILENYNFIKIYEKKIDAVSKRLLKPTNNGLYPFVRSNAEMVGHTFVKNSNIIIGLLSVVIPFYNMGKYIDSTIESIKSSIALPIEIIIVNDGSNDLLSLEKLTAYRSDKLIRVIDSVNKGLAHARNIGAQVAKGEFLAFLDADDLVAPDYYAKAVNILKHYSNVSYVGSWTQYFEGSEKVWPTFIPEPPLILFHNTINSSSLVYKKFDYQLAGKNDENMPFQGLEDYESVVSLVSQGKYGVVLPEPLFYYRVRSDSMIRGVSKEKKVILFNYIAKKHLKIYSKYAADIYGLANSNGPSILLDNPSADFNYLFNFPFNNKLTRLVLSKIKSQKFLKRFALKIYNNFLK